MPAPGTTAEKAVITLDEPCLDEALPCDLDGGQNPATCRIRIDCPCNVRYWWLCAGCLDWLRRVTSDGSHYVQCMNCDSRATWKLV